MPCHIARYQHKGPGELGWALVQGGVYRIESKAQSTRAFLNSSRELAFKMSKNLDDYAEHKLLAEDLALLSPITKGGRIIGQGSNYPAARKDAGMDPSDKSFNMLFHKSEASLSPPDADIVRPAHIKLLDYEIELGVVLGREVNEPVVVNESNITDYVAGVVIAHDVTARDEQIPQVQYFKGKSYRTFCPRGPYLCLFDKNDGHYLSKLNLSLSVNGELKQRDHSCNMIFKPHETLTELSNITDLAPGDMILTGSPGGCALTVPPKPVVKALGLIPESTKWKLFIKGQSKNEAYLKPGDFIEAAIKSDDCAIDLGLQLNKVVAEA